MAQPTNTFDTYDAVGIREDLEGKIYNVDPFDTPLLAMVDKVKATNTLHEWQTDTLDSPSSSNTNIEGDDTIADAITATTRRGNYTQILKKSVTVPNTVEVVDKAGRAKESAYHLAKKAKALKTDIESSVFANTARAAGSSTTARVMAGIPTWMTSNTAAGATGSDATGDGTDTRTNGTQRALTESVVKTVLASCWDNGGNPDHIFLGSFNKQVFSGFTGNATRFDKAEDAVLHTTVDVYVSDFGRLKLIPSRHIAARDCFIMQKQYWALAVLRGMKQEELAKTGDSRKFHIISECTLVARNEASSGFVADLTTS